MKKHLVKIETKRGTGHNVRVVVGGRQLSGVLAIEIDPMVADDFITATIKVRVGKLALAGLRADLVEIEESRGQIDFDGNHSISRRHFLEG